MEKNRWKLIKAMVIFLWCAAAPQMLFVDCIHPVFEDTGEETQMELSEKDYVKLFRLDQSDYKITLKYDIRKWLSQK
ncbi:MAG: hypothetical protein ACI4EI_09685 [Muricoprocola sp.]